MIPLVDRLPSVDERWTLGIVICGAAEGAAGWTGAWKGDAGGSVDVVVGTRGGAVCCCCPWPGFVLLFPAAVFAAGVFASAVCVAVAGVDTAVVGVTAACVDAGAGACV